MWSLVFISGKYKGGTYHLPPDGSLLLGRQTEVDIPIIEDMVSRTHARLMAKGKSFSIEDLGSTNGTYVNGKRIEGSLPLHAGDLVLIGKSVMEVVQEGVKRSPISPGPPPIPEAPSTTLDTIGARSSTAQPGKPPPDTSLSAQALAGRLQSLSVPDLLDIFLSRKKWGILQVKQEWGPRAMVVLAAGETTHAFLEDRPSVEPQKALFRTFGWTNGTFHFDSSPEGYQPDLGAMGEYVLENPTRLLMDKGLQELEAIRQLRQEEQVPDETDSLVLDMPMIPRLQDLKPEMLETLQLVHNFGLVEEILNRSANSDLKTYQELTYLKAMGYVRLA